ncbi:dual specificity phosphatase, catalytic domain containing protein, putative [Babesia bigemina]|uniref:protein-tyrosine-phosphatase n=1 Tax=Babesia bigemina TaxID=5866 RepID=A0A061DAE3_BABBI|nr:dual specificity phosphatase, catalytic domain containing protein, putative [Babesia bigemina]CDR96947.1 dual specificity phosphatase, catalytic domain containing protein, putative [Babesia bigemina]|eukprot:XP_012769133.1 dual specificity phosphatase, catalytic domain containing protein, putative [Babesia bigemina]
MSRVVDGLYVGDLYTAHRLFDDVRLPPDRRPPNRFESGSAPDNLRGVISACFDAPEWCSESAGCFYQCDGHESAAYSHLIKSPRFDSDYINLHVDRIPHYRAHQASEPDSDENQSTYVLHMVVNAEDASNEKLFRAFPFAFDFVEAVSTLCNGSTFVHCMMGMSRSCSLVCAYLMKKQDTTFTSVIKQLKSVHPIASPSAGFMCQLLLFYKHGFEVPNRDVFWSEYIHLIRHIDLDKPEEYEAKCRDPNSEADNGTVYSCAKCRQTLFYGYNVIQHEGVADSRDAASEPCSSVFVEPMDWMNDVDSQTGKIMCKNTRCSSKLGYYCWYGRRCSCGHLQVPAFQIQLSKVDKLVAESRLGGTKPVRNEGLL